MFYSQTCENIQLIVFTLDGGLLDINRLRYNYYRSTCETYHKNASREEFSKMLGNMNTMYDHSLLEDIIPAKEFNKAVEKDLFEYIKLKPSIKREGVDELIQYCKQKNMKIAVYTTHKTKRAIQYLQLTGLYEKIDFLIGGDSHLKPLPHCQMLEVTCQQMDIEPSHTMIVANFESMVEAANKLLANVIYMPDLSPATEKIKASVYKVTKNPLEIMNMFLFSKYDSVEMFSPILGMNANMDLDTLTQTRDKLLEKYKDDEQLIGLVNKTYDYFNEILLKQFLIEELEKNEKKHFSFDDEDSTLKGKQNIEMFEEENNQEEMIKEEAEVPFLDEKKDLFQEQSVLKNTTSIDPKRINELMDIINGNAEAEENVETEEKVEEVKEKDKSKMDTFMDGVYSLLISIILVFAFLIFRIILQEFIISIPSLNSMAITLEKGYLKILEVLFGFVFNSLHMLFKIVPTYKVFVYQNSLLSPMAVLCLFSIILIFIIISMIKGMINLIKNKD
ncbi:MAG: HAD family hydrolase [Faecalibacillus faecis]|uniref:HAD family hydrolase n=1 Tax=Faecalibacillus faecis TaxID=1982628 RepID=UPI003993E153